jgi:pimeloyl-ACP methyl ester carboxylesterase
VVVGDVTGTVLTTADGERLAARWWLPRRGAGGGGPVAAVVVVHGFCGGKDTPEVEMLAVRLATDGRAVLTFDLRGHHTSTGRCSLGLHERHDVDAAVAAARDEADVVLVVGSSLGAVATLDHLASAAPADPGRADGAVLVAAPARWKMPLTSRGVMAVALTQTWPGRTFLARRAATRVEARPARPPQPIDQIRAVTRPIALLHGLDDRYVLPGAARTLHAAAPGPRLLDLVPGMGHGLGPAAVAPVAAAVDWVRGAAGRETLADEGAAEGAGT